MFVERGLYIRGKELSDKFSGSSMKGVSFYLYMKCRLVALHVIRHHVITST
jgi:hypothetical protein